jgi:hypothetical protein
MKLERMKALIRARLEVIEEKQSAAVGKLSALSGVYPLANETLPAKVAPRGYDSGGMLKFPSVTVKNAPKKERMGLFAGLR